MSKKSSYGRKLDPIRVQMAQQAQRVKHDLAMKMVSERVKIDAEFAADVLKIAGEGLREDIKKDAAETIAKANTQVVGELDGVPILSNLTGGTGAVEQTCCGGGCGCEELPYTLDKESVREYMNKNGLTRMADDGGCTPCEISKEKLQEALQKLSEKQTERLKTAGLI